MEEMIQKAVNYVNQNTELLVENVNETFEEEKEWIRKQVVQLIQERFSQPLPHYRWEYDGCPYDRSGTLVKEGEISDQQTVSDFLENEYTGGRVPTYESHRRFAYDTYGDWLSQESLTIADNIMMESVKTDVESYLGEKVPKEVMDEIQSRCNDFDDIYINSVAADFFCHEGVIEYTEIGDRMLSEILSESI